MSSAVNRILPPGWAQAPLEEIGDIQLGKMLDRTKRTEGTPLPYVRNINVRWGSVDLSDLLTMPFKDAELERFAIRDGDVLVCEGGEPGRAAVWRHGQDRAIKYQKAIHRVRLDGGIHPQWLAYSLWHDAMRGALGRRFTGTTIKHFTREAICRYPLLIPPLSEQKRIVAAVEEQLSKLDAGMQTADRARANLTRYHGSVLRAAVEGSLVPTEADLARQEGRVYEPAGVLLERILAERASLWQKSQEEKLAASGASARGRYTSPIEPATHRLPCLPAGWEWTTLDQLSYFTVDYRGKTPPTSDSGVPIISAANVKGGRIVIDKPRFVSRETYAEWTTRGFPAPGDLLVTTEAPVGEVALYPSDRTYLLTRRVIGFKTNGIDNRYLSCCFSSEIVRRHLAANNRGTTVPRILKPALLATPIPLPPAEEQSRIVQEIERQLSVAEETEATLAAAVTRSGKLRRSILRLAFAGKMVDQDSSDEPAETLLARIRERRGGGSTSTGSRRRGGI